MALVYEGSWTSPTSNAQIYIDTTRSGAQVTVTATVSCNLVYSSGYINYDGEINFNMWCSGASTGANIKGYSDRWAAGTARNRTRVCSMTVTNTSGALDIGFNITIPSSRPAGAAFRTGDQYRTVGLPGYAAPTAPTWVNINPNPCGINVAPLISWGGANVGSLGVLRYDVQVRSTKSSGGWTNWLNIASAQGSASYQEVVLNRMNVYGQTPYIGVKYQYRIRSSDGSYATSGWINSSELVVSFGNPTPPTSYTLSDSSIKKEGAITISWTGATGGTGTISAYYLDYRIYNHSTSIWTNWINIYSSGITSYTFNLPSFYPDAKNGDLLQFRIRVLNSWGQYSEYLVTASISIRGNQIWIEINGTWIEGDCYFRTNEIWYEATPYIKVNDIWKEST